MTHAQKLYYPGSETHALGKPIDNYIPEEWGKTWNKIAIIGKAPGSVERIENRPFSGKSGHLLDKLLEQAGIDPRETLMSNAFMVQPSWTMNPDGKRNLNDVSLFFSEELKYCNPKLPLYHNKGCLNGFDIHVRNLWKLLGERRPQMIIALGDIALWAVTGKDKIGDCLGQFQPFRDPSFLDVQVFSTYHPAYALHKQSEDIAIKIGADLKTAAAWFAKSKEPIDIPEDCPF